MGIFRDKKSGFVDQIRCDEQSYLIWKWRPYGYEKGNNRENAIRWGSSLRVKDGEVAVFVYNQSDGINQDFIEGPFDKIIETKNFPILTSIVGLAYAGGTPFQAEVYFINLAKVIQVPFAVPYFDIFDSRFVDFGVPTAVRGNISFNIDDYKEFIKLHRLSDFNLDDFQNQIKATVARCVKDVVINIPIEKNIPVVQIEREIGQINEIVERELKGRLFVKFGVNVSALDISAVEIDKNSDGYKQLKAVTQDIASVKMQAQTDVDIKNLHDMQRINIENMEESLRIQREKVQYAQHIQTLNSSEMMNGMLNEGNTSQQLGAIHSSMSSSCYHIVVNGQSSGPYDIDSLCQLIKARKITKDTLIWKQGMVDWDKADNVQELMELFGDIPPALSGNTPPPIPTIK